MHDENFEEDVRGKLIMEASEAVQKTFNTTESYAVILTGMALKQLGYVSVKEILAYLQSVKKNVDVAKYINESGY